jgi:hypothetical protein
VVAYRFGQIDNRPDASEQQQGQQDEVKHRDEPRVIRVVLFSRILLSHALSSHNVAYSILSRTMFTMPFDHLCRQMIMS